MLRLTLLLLFGLIFFASALDDSTESSEESTESGNDTVPQDLWVNEFIKITNFGTKMYSIGT